MALDTEKMTKPNVNKIASTWTREGTINFYWKDGNKLYRNRDLFDGGQFLNLVFLVLTSAFIERTSKNCKKPELSSRERNPKNLNKKSLESQGNKSLVLYMNIHSLLNHFDEFLFSYKSFQQQSQFVYQKP